MPRPTFVPYWKGIFLFLRDTKTDWKPKVLLIMAIVYLLWPVDVLPDVLPIIGWLDDIGAASVAVWYLSRSAERYFANQGKRPS